MTGLAVYHLRQELLGGLQNQEVLYLSHFQKHTLTIM